MNTDIREEVSAAYTDALRRSKARSGGCCGSASASPSGARAYGQERERYAEAAQSSFGCGNPLALADVAEGQTVLDLGSGAGLDLLLASDRVGPTGRVIGVDMTDAMLEAARANVAAAGKPNVELRKGTIEQLPVEDSSVDWVISNCVINLSPDKPAVFREIARVLRPGGRFSVSDIVANDLPDWLRQSVASYVACLGGAISEPDYLAGLEAAGLQGARVVERLVYDREQLLALIAEDFGALDLSPALLAQGLAAVEGHIASVRVVGSR